MVCWRRVQRVRRALRGAASLERKGPDELGVRGVSERWSGLGASKVGWMRKGRMTDATKVTTLKIRRANVPRRVPRSHTFSTSSGGRFGSASKIGST